MIVWIFYFTFVAQLYFTETIKNNPNKLRFITVATFPIVDKFVSVK